MKLLSGLFVSSEGYTLGSTDVGDAYLIVEQDEPTVVEVDGRYYQLGFTLPGQRIESSAWFGKLKGYLEEFGLKSDDGLPALFFKRPENGKQGMIVLSHVDDMELYASKEEFHRLVEFLKGKGLKIKVEGPMNEVEGSMSFLKRGFHATSEGNVEITMNSLRVIEGLVEVLGLEKAYTKKIPCPADNGRAFQAQKGGQDPLTPELHHVYRKGVGILLYLAPERPDVMYVLAKYLKGTPDITLVHRKSYPGKSFRHARESEETERNPYEQESLIEVISDSDWAADRESRQSVSCGAIMLNGNLIHFQSKRQKCVSLSSCEAETVAATSILSEAVFLRSLLTRVLGKEPKMVLYSDSSSSRQLIARKGLGKARHLDVDLLWIQRIEDLKIKPIKGKDNPADLGTKSLTRDKIRKYMVTIGYVGDDLDEGEAVDTSEAEVRIVQRAGRFEEGRLQRIIQAVTVAVLVGLGEAYEERSEGSPDEDQRAGLSTCTIVIAGLLFMCICRKVITAAVLLKGRFRAKAEGRRKEREEKMSATREGTKVLNFAESGDMTEEEYVAELKRQIRDESRSIESTTILEEWLKKVALEKYEDPKKILQVVKELNKHRQDEATPPEKAKQASDDEAASDPTSSSEDSEEDKDKESQPSKPEATVEEKKEELRKILQTRTDKMVAEQMQEEEEDPQMMQAKFTEQRETIGDFEKERNLNSKTQNAAYR